MNIFNHPSRLRAGCAGFALCLGLGAAAAAGNAARPAETCQSPYMAKITGEEEFVYVWTLGVEGMGDGSDKLVTVDMRAHSPTFGQIIDVDSVDGRHEARHAGPDQRRHLWLAGLDTNQTFIFDVASAPANPRLVKTVAGSSEESGGVVGPHGVYVGRDG